MSVICGVFNTDGGLVSEDLCSIMMNKLKVYPIDKPGTLLNQGLFFGSGLQYITPESKKEKLPLYDKKKGIAITADAIIDNREELFDTFNISKELIYDITDSKLILMAYDKWGQDCPKYLVGDFTFAIWDENKRKLFCARDHVGERTLYYYQSKNVFAFCTIMKPLLAICETKMDLNERWITDFLALEGIQHEFECNETIYKNIFQLPPSYTITIDAEGIKKNKYWDPLSDVRPLLLKSDKEYDEAFKKVFFEAVRCRLRSTDEVGIMLSGGLDSGTVACVAAKELSNQDKTLKGFSSIPMKGYKNKSTNYVSDESDYIKEICNHVGNIDVNYCRSEGKNSFSNIDSFINVLEQPYKIVQTIYWYNDIVEKASENKCKVLLNGQFGNSTISDGEFLIHALTLYRKKKIITLFNEIKTFSKLKKVNPNKVGKIVLKAIIPYKLRKFVSNSLNKDYNRFLTVPVNPNLIKKWNVEKRFDEKYYNQHIERFLDYYESQKYTVDPLAFSHIGAIETKLSLAKGIVIRDPTKDKRVIEFCLSLPSDQFVRNGQERLIIRRSMKGILPDKIRLNTSTRGLQSADWVQRLAPQWEDVCIELERVLNDEAIKTYIDCDRLKNQLVGLKDGLNEKNAAILRMFLITLVFSRFIKAYNS